MAADEELVEAVGALLAARDLGTYWDEVGDASRSHYRSIARAVLAVPAVADAFRDAERLRSLAATFGDDLEGALARDAKVGEIVDEGISRVEAYDDLWRIAALYPETGK